MVRESENMRIILDYLNKNTKKGYKIDDLKISLMSQGYSRTTIEESIKIFQEKLKKEMVEMNKPIAPKVEDIQVVEEKRGFWSRLFGFGD